MEAKVIPNSTTSYGKKLALSRSKSGHQITFRDDLPSVPTVAEHRPLDMSHSLSIALEVGHNNRRRRNSISLLFSRQRASSEQYTSTSFANVQRPSSGQKQQSKYRMIRLPFSSSSNKDNNTENPVLQLEDSFADIRLQLASMSQETQEFTSRVQTLSRAVSDLSNQQIAVAQKQNEEEQATDVTTAVRSNPQAVVNRSNTTYHKNRRQRELIPSTHYSASTLPLPPIERVHSQPSPLLNSWNFVPVGSQSTDSSSGSISQSSCSQLTAGSDACESPSQQLFQLPDINVLVVEDSDSTRSSECEEEIREQDDEVFKF